MVVVVTEPTIGTVVDESKADVGTGVDVTKEVVGTFINVIEAVVGMGAVVVFTNTVAVGYWRVFQLAVENVHTAADSVTSHNSNISLYCIKW